MYALMIALLVREGLEHVPHVQGFFSLTELNACQIVPPTNMKIPLIINAHYAIRNARNVLEEILTNAHNVSQTITTIRLIPNVLPHVL